MLSGNGSDAGGTLFRINTAGPSVSGTEKSDVYQIGDYHVNASSGSDFFVMGMGSSNQNTYGLFQNANYNNGAISTRVQIIVRIWISFMFHGFLRE